MSILPLLLGWVLMVLAMVKLSLGPAERPALLYWAAVSLAACVLGALAIASQSVGQPTLAGRFGSSVVRWGFRATQGRLWGATIISWLLWLVIGSAVILGIRAQGNLPYRMMLLAWTVDFGILCYLLGVWLMNRGSGMHSLLTMAAILIGMIAVSGTLWFANGSDAARKTALMVGGGPPLVIGTGYGLFLLVVMTVGRNARWN